MERIGAGEHTAFLSAFRDPGPLTSTPNLLNIGFHGRTLFRRGNFFHQRMFRGQDHIGRAEQRIRPSGKHFDLVIRRTRDFKEDAGSFGTANPIALHFFNGFGPIDLIQILDESISIGGNPQHPLPHGYANDGMTTPFALAILHFLVSQDGPQSRAPVHGHFSNIGQSLFIEFSENPLRPPHIPRIGGINFPGPIVVQPQRLQLTLKRFDITPGGLSRMGSCLNRILLRGKPERIPSHGVQHIKAPHAFVSGDNIRGDVALRMPDVQSRSGGIREHVQHVKLGLGVIQFSPKDLVILPILLPLGFDSLWIVRCHEILPYYRKGTP